MLQTKRINRRVSLDTSFEPEQNKRRAKDSKKPQLLQLDLNVPTQKKLKLSNKTSVEQNTDFKDIFQPPKTIIPLSQFLDCKYIPRECRFREQEIKQVEQFLEKKIQVSSKKEVHFLMVSGLPGSGKTMVVNRVLDSYEGGLIRSIRLNAMTFKGMRDFWQAVVEKMQEYSLEFDDVSKKNKEQLKKSITQQASLLAKDKRVIVLMVDEFECLFNDKEGFDLFWLCSDINFKIKIIGLSNDTEFLYNQGRDVDLPQIENIVFQSYNAQQVQSIIESRFDEIRFYGDRVCTIDRDALQFCVGKSIIGKGADLRNVLDMFKRAVMKKSHGEYDIQIEKEDLSSCFTGVNQFIESNQHILSSLSLNLQILLLGVYLVQGNSEEMKEIDITEVMEKVKWINQKLDLQNIQYSIDQFKGLSDYNMIEVKESSIRKFGIKILVAKVKCKIGVKEMKQVFQTINGLKEFL